MRRWILFLVLLLCGLAFAQSSGFMQTFISQLTDVAGMLDTFRQKLELVSAAIRRLAPALSLLALLYGAFLLLAGGGLEALRGSLFRLLMVVVLLGMTPGIWTAGTDVWNAARLWGTQFIKTEAQDAAKDLTQLGQTMGDFIAVTVAVSSAPGQAENTSEALQESVNTGVNKVADDGMAAVFWVNLLLFAFGFLYYLIVLGTGFAVTVAGGMFPFAVILVAFPGPTGVMWVGHFFKVAIRSIFIVALVPLVFSLALSLGVVKPVKDLVALVDDVTKAQAQLVVDVQEFVNKNVPCDTACEVLYKEKRDALVDKISTGISQFLGFVKSFSLVLVVLLMGLEGGWFLLRRFERDLMELLGGFAMDISRTLSRVPGAAAAWSTGGPRPSSNASSGGRSTIGDTPTKAGP